MSRYNWTERHGCLHFRVLGRRVYVRTDAAGAGTPPYVLDPATQQYTPMTNPTLIDATWVRYRAIRRQQRAQRKSW